MHYLAHTTFSLPFFFGLQTIWSSPAGLSDAARSRAAKPAPGGAATASIARRSAGTPQAPAPQLNQRDVCDVSRHAGASMPSGTALAGSPGVISQSDFELPSDSPFKSPKRTQKSETTTFHPSPIQDTKHSTKPRQIEAPSLEKSHVPTGSPAGLNGLETQRKSADLQATPPSPFQQEFWPETDFYELALDPRGELQAGAGMDKTLRSNPSAVRTFLRDAFDQEMTTRLGPLDPQAIDSHWASALGVHSGAGTKGRPVLVFQLKLLAQYLERHPVA